MDFFELVKKRRSVRAFLSVKVEKEKIEKIVEAGLWAPSGTNLQAWKIAVVESEKMIGDLKKLTEESFQIYTRLKIEKLFGGISSIIDSSRSFAATLGGAQTVIAVFSEKIEDEHERMIAFQSVSAVIQNIQLAVVELGLSSCWMSDVMKKGNEITSLLGLNPSEYELAALIPIGYSEKYPKLISRKKDRVFYILK
ncbi:MAG TPA: hypothetical protein DHW82_13355 [Spirochaetia bacterium]|nr:MAG: hypothetical protein A2Y41_07635 [Spirochaetes bacterium GWB1_36_13]HCL57976.1 hypothetical protein [Spirochaetia bacterium]